MHILWGDTMKAIILRSGKLMIQRAGAYKLQHCPYSSWHGDEHVDIVRAINMIADVITGGPFENTEQYIHEEGPIHCGHWCPHFGEPKLGHFDTCALATCKNTLYLDELIDHRHQNEVVLPRDFNPGDPADN